MNIQWIICSLIFILFWFRSCVHSFLDALACKSSWDFWCRQAKRRAGLRPQSSATCQEFRTYILLWSNLDWPTSLSGWSIWYHLLILRLTFQESRLVKVLWQPLPKKLACVLLRPGRSSCWKNMRNREMCNSLSQGRRLRKRWPRQFCCTFPHNSCFLPMFLVLFYGILWYFLLFSLLENLGGSRLHSQKFWNWCDRLTQIVTDHQNMKQA